MGCCLSSSSFLLPTAKLILHDGGLTEFFEPVIVERAIAGMQGFFICDSDSMSVDLYLCPLPSEEKLQLDEIYFLFPVKKLQYALRASDMVALAVKASSAIKPSGCKRGYTKVRPSTEERVDLFPARKENQRTIWEIMTVEESEGSKSRNGSTMKRMASTGRGLINKTLLRKLSTIKEEFSS